MDKEIVSLLLKIMSKEGEQVKLPFEIGKSYFFRTATYHVLGRLKEINGKFLTLEDASWIADSGRFMEFIDDGKANEVEPVKTLMYVNSDSICDSYLWKHDLIRTQK